MLIECLRLTASQVYLVHGPRPVLVDVGLARDAPTVTAWLARKQIAPRDLGAIILTHAHADHAGAVSALAHWSGAPVVVGMGDVSTVHSGGRDGSSPPTGVRRVLASFGLIQAYPPLPRHYPVIPVETGLELEALGGVGAVLPVPGHTSGSVAVVLDSGDVIAGDVLIGGYLLGVVARSTPVSHFHHVDRLRNRASIGALLSTGAHTWHLGHGGPVASESVRAWLDRSPGG